MEGKTVKKEKLLSRIEKLREELDDVINEEGVEKQEVIDKTHELNELLNEYYDLINSE